MSELTVENFAAAFTVPRISISDKKVIYRSDIIFTPLLNQSEIDAEPIKAFVAEQYRQAGIHKQDIQMGAVIITGETAQKAMPTMCYEHLVAMQVILSLLRLDLI